MKIKCPATRLLVEVLIVICGAVLILYGLDYALNGIFTVATK